MLRICPHCYYEGKGRRQLRGSRAVEIFIWAVLLIPGPFYSLWRRMGAPRTCPNCGRAGMVSLSSSEGIIAKAELDRELGILPVSRISSLDTPPPIPAQAKREAKPSDNIW